MKLLEFVAGLKKERDAMLESYMGDGATTIVASKMRAAALTAAQRTLVITALDAALTDAFYTVLLALDGAASINGTQQAFSILDDGGNVSEGNGRLEALAFEIFQSHERRLPTT